MTDPDRPEDVNAKLVAVKQTWAAEKRGLTGEPPPAGKPKLPPGQHEVKAWQSVLRGYLRGRPGLTRAFVLIDSRHGILKADEEMFDLLDEAAVTYQVVLTKTDKIKPAELEKVYDAVAAAIKKHPAAFPQIHATSSDKGHGIPELRAEIAGLL